ncbi:MAG TPA: hypothetical protein VJT09_15100 [Pyrinomonadaceae bacterium]|nr:hypothetical protein [Pyrinomonadaceae bacterium]
MSEDTTQITLRTVLEAINALGVELHNFRAEMQGFREAVEVRPEEIESSLDILASDVLRVRARESLARKNQETVERLLNESDSIDAGKKRV